MQLNVLTRRIIVGGEMQACCVDKLARVVDSLAYIAVGDSVVDLAGATGISAHAADAIVSLRELLAVEEISLSIIEARPDVRRALHGAARRSPR